jgi:tetratricopeptide (TPR) repeat protein
MTRPAICSAVVLVLASAPLFSQEPDRRKWDADFRLAQNACKAAVDSGSLGVAISQLNGIAARDPNYPGLKPLLERCSQEYTRQKSQDDLLFAEAKAAYEQRRVEEAKFKFQNLAGRNTDHTAAAKNYLSLIVSAGSAGASAASQQDYDNLEQAKRYFKANSYDKAKPMFDVLLGKGGTLAAEAKKYLDQIELHNSSAALMQAGITALRQRRYQDALDTFMKVRQQDPDYPGLASNISQAQAAGAKAAASAPAAPNLQRGKTLFEEKDYAGALKFFRDLQTSSPDSAEIQGWVRKAEAAVEEEQRAARLGKLLNEGRGFLRRKEYAQAENRFRRALAMEPDDEDIRKLLSQAVAGVKETGQAEDRSAIQAALLDEGIRAFYKGDFRRAGEALEQYAAERGRHSALAYFYLGAIAGTEYFLGGEKDSKKAARAEALFAESRKASSQFQPPRDWVSPKIITMYQKVAAGR